MSEGTKRLYFEDPYRVDFTARVVDRKIHGENPALVLDRTCFYPEGGGQPADRGVINGIPVLNVLEEGEEILHVMERDVPGEEVEGKVDWDKRFEHMQQHSGQHILSQCLVRLFDAPTLSFHLGEKASTLEFGKGEMTEEEVESLEGLANDIVFQDREIRTRFYGPEETGKIPLRKPPKKKGVIRVVEISDFDWTACGGTHPRRTGEIGLIKILRLEKIRGNVRLEFLCGRRALRDYAWKHRDLRAMANRLTVDASEVRDVFERLLEERREQTKKIRKLQESLAGYEADDLARKAEGGVVRRVFADRELQGVRRLALSLVREREAVALFGLKAGERVHLVLACGESLGLDLRELVPLLGPVIEGKGGGRPTLVEMAGTRKEGLEEALDRAEAWARRLGAGPDPG